MKAVHRAMALWVLALLGTLALLSVLLSDRYSYYDYQEGKCDADGRVQVAVTLVGSFGFDRPKERSSPYFLRVELLGANKGHVVLSDAKLTSSESGVNVDLGAAKRVEVTRRGDLVPVVTYSVNNLQLEYDDYTFDGVILSDSMDKSREAAFTCSLTRSYRTEWRVPLWDALMSV